MSSSFPVLCLWLGCSHHLGCCLSNFCWSSYSHPVISTISNSTSSMKWIPQANVTCSHFSSHRTSHSLPFIIILLVLVLSIISLAFLLYAVQSLSRVWLFATPWTAARQASLSITISRSLPKLMSIGSVMPSNHLILCHPHLLLPSIFPSIRVFSNKSVLCIRWPKYWSFSFNISPSNEHSGLISFRMDWLDLLVVQDSQESSPTPQFKSINSSALSFLYNPTLTSIHDHWKNHSLD